MDDKTIAALLALPDGAIVALFWAAGPGWEVWADKPPRLLDASDDGDEEPDGWLPCNPLEIVRVAVERERQRTGERHLAAVLVVEDDGTASAWTESGRMCMEGPRTGYGSGEGPTAHLAALALLGEVFGG